MLLANRITQDMAVLIADSNAYTRRLVRQMLNTIGVRAVYETPDGIAVIDAISALNPDVLILDWQLRGLCGPEVMRIVRTPGVFPKAGIPVIMLTDLGLQSRVMMAMQVGVHELLVKPISPRTLQQRLFGIFMKPRPMVRAGNLYIPMPRRHSELYSWIK